jgi:CheY-like chemotaxis protein
MIKILVVDDEKGIRILVPEEIREVIDAEFILRDSGYKLMETIEEEKPDLVILDIKMVDYDGLELLQDIRSKFYDLPVIMYTAYHTFKEDMKSIAANFYVVKSFDTSELILKTLIVLVEKGKTVKPPEHFAIEKVTERFRWSLNMSDFKRPISCKNKDVQEFLDHFRAMGFQQFFPREEAESLLTNLINVYNKEIQIAHDIIRKSISKKAALTAKDLCELYEKMNCEAMSQATFIQQARKLGAKVEG